MGNRARSEISVSDRDREKGNCEMDRRGTGVDRVRGTRRGVRPAEPDWDGVFFVSCCMAVGFVLGLVVGL